MRRYPGHAGPNADAYAIRHALTPDPFVASQTQWGLVWAVHAPSTNFTTLASAADVGASSLTLNAEPAGLDVLYFPFATTLAADAALGATSVSLDAAPVVGTQIAVGMWSAPMTVSAVSGSGPYTVDLTAPAGAGYSGLIIATAAGAAVNAVSVPLYTVTPGGVSGSGPYTAKIRPQIVVPEYPAGTTVGRVATVDVWLDGIITDRNADGTPEPYDAATGQAYVASLRHASGYSPTVGDYVFMTRSNLSTGGSSDRFVVDVCA